MPHLERFALPDVGEGLTEAELVAWAVAPGDTVTVNQTVCEIETAKSVVELPCPWDGVVREVLVEEGRTVAVGSPLLVVEVAGEEPGGAAPTAGEAAVAADAAPAPETHADDRAGGAVLVGYGTPQAAPSRRRRRGVAAAAEAAPAPAPAPDPTPAPAPVASAGTVQAMAKPPVRKLAKDLGVDLMSVQPTGRGGIVTREDVLAAAERSAQPAPATPAPAPWAAPAAGGDQDQPWLVGGTRSDDGRSTRVPVRGVRKQTAAAMVASAFTAPHATLFHTVDVTATMDLVARLKTDRELAAVRVTPLVVVMRALLLAVRRHPQANARWDEAAQEIVYRHYVNLGIAAATERGLLVPNIKDAHAMTLPELARALEELTTTARAGRTTPETMADGTITITNVGVFGTDTGTPILNPGEAAILAFGAIRKQPWVVEDRIEPRWITQLALSVDHRVIDGDVAARVLADIARVLEDPAQALVWA